MDALTLSLWLFVVVVCAFDLRTQRIPDPVNLAGGIVGLGLMWWLRSEWLWPLVGALLGATLLTLLGLLGKRLFGQREHKFAAERFAIELDDGKYVLRSGDANTDPWGDLFTSAGDRVELTCVSWAQNERGAEGDVLVCSRDRCESKTTGRILKLSNGAISGVWTGLKQRVEVMGWGDVKMAAALGTFFGLQTPAVLAAACLLAALVGLPLRKLGVKEFPFGPSLGAAAVLWWHFGAGVWGWYLARFWHG